MARSQHPERRRGDRGRTGTLQIGTDWLELTTATTSDASALRAWIGQVNGAAFTQPYLVEGPRGRFRLYVGEAAERERTAHGIR